MYYQQKKISSKAKSDTIYKEIRRNQLEDIRASYRKKNFFVQGEERQQLLKDINIAEAFQNLKKQPEKVQDSIHKLFLYATSTQSDHLFFMFSESDVLTIEKLLTIYHPQSQQNKNKKQQRIKIKALWILSNYTAYCKKVPTSYLQKLSILWAQNQENQQFKDLIILSLANLTEVSQIVNYLIENYLDFVNSVVQSMDDYAKETQTSPKYKPQVCNLCSFYQNLIHSLPYEKLPYNDKMIVILTQLFIQTQIKEIKVTLLETVRYYIVVYIEKKPSLIMSEEESFRNMGVWLLQNSDKVQNIKANKYEILSCLKIFSYLFSVNIPEDKDQQKYVKIFSQLFQQYLVKVSPELFKSNDLNIIVRLLQLYEPICMQQFLCEYLFQDYLLIINIIQNCANSQQFRMKKHGLICLCNCVMSSIYDSSVSKDIILETFLQMKFEKMLAETLYSVVDEQLNIALLSALQILSELSDFKLYRQDQQRFQNIFFRRFAQQGGIKNLQRLTEHSKKDISQLAATILQNNLME